MPETRPQLGIHTETVLEEKLGEPQNYIIKGHRHQSILFGLNDPTDETWCPWKHLEPLWYIFSLRWAIELNITTWIEIVQLWILCVDNFIHASVKVLV